MLYQDTSHGLHLDPEAARLPLSKAIMAPWGQDGACFPLKIVMSGTRESAASGAGKTTAVIMQGCRDCDIDRFRCDLARLSLPDSVQGSSQV